jgi:putative hydrolase of the HAD superfamily
VNHRQHFRFLLCDLDDTLYPMNAGLMKAVGERIGRFMIEHLDIPAETAPDLRAYFHERYGTSMRGLILYYDINPERYLEFVHDLPLAQFIQPNPALDAVLARICLTRVIFTNASCEHAQRVLDRLGVSRRFERIIDVRDFGFHSKPHRAAYERTLHILGANPEECIIVEDSDRNLAPARAMGMFGVLVRGEATRAQDGANAADIYIDDILELAQAIEPLTAC